VARRNAISSPDCYRSTVTPFSSKEGTTCLDEAQDVIHMVKYDAKISAEVNISDSVVIDGEIIRDLRDYVSMIASMYKKDNSFHNFEHACHVTMSGQ
jgi:hypothetical protein